ncbi:MAG: methyltransferase domain-containing protein [Rhodospirillales bacterium]|nr:methyltransferase domain-containing protein [Rhodospirillales bacterium]
MTASSSLLFDRTALRQGRERAARFTATHGFLFDRTIDQINRRLEDIRRSFPVALQTGGRGNPDLREKTKQAGGIETLLTMDISPALPTDFIAAEDALPFARDSLDAVISPLSLHSVNDLPGALVQINYALKPDGLFLGALFGGETLRELRQCLMQAEIATRGGTSPRIAPMIDKQQAGALLQRAGFALPVVDSELLTVTYNDALGLMQDLRFMGESNFVAKRDKSWTGKTLFTETARLYHEQFAEADGRIAATFEIIYLIGWAPHDSQQQPLCPGSGKVSLADVLGDQSS